MKYIILNFPPEINISCNTISSKKVVLIKNIIENIRNKKFNFIILELISFLLLKVKANNCFVLINDK